MALSDLVEAMRHWVHELLEQTVIKEKLPQTMRDALIRVTKLVESSPDYLFRTNKAEEIYEEIHECADLGGLAKSIFDIAALFHFQHGSIFLISPGRINTIWMSRVCTSLPERWLRKYKERAYQFIDPAAIKATNSNSPSLVTRCASNSPMAKAFWNDAEAFGVGSACVVFRIQLESGAVLGFSLTSQRYSKRIIEDLALDMSDLNVLTNEVAARFEKLSAAYSQPERALTMDDLAFLRLLLVNVDATKAQKFRAFLSSSAAMQTSIATKLGADNILQAFAIAINCGMLDDLPLGESEINSLFASLSGFQAIN